MEERRFPDSFAFCHRPRLLFEVGGAILKVREEGTQMREESEKTGSRF